MYAYACSKRRRSSNLIVFRWKDIAKERENRPLASRAFFLSISYRLLEILSVFFLCMYPKFCILLIHFYLHFAVGISAPPSEHACMHSGARSKCLPQFTLIHFLLLLLFGFYCLQQEAAAGLFSLSLSPSKPRTNWGFLAFDILPQFPEKHVCICCCCCCCVYILTSVLGGKRERRYEKSKSRIEEGKKIKATVVVIGAE